jgi:hypothetical protein
MSRTEFGVLIFLVGRPFLQNAFHTGGEVSEPAKGSSPDDARIRYDIYIYIYTYAFLTIAGNQQSLNSGLTLSDCITKWGNHISMTQLKRDAAKSAQLIVIGMGNL